MPSINNCNIAGHAGRDAEINHRDNDGNPVIASVSIAITESIKAGGEWRKETTWVKVKAIGSTARMLARAVRGSLVVVNGGNLRTESWTGKDGQSKSQAVVLVMQPAICFCVPAGSVLMPDKSNDKPVDKPSSVPSSEQADGGAGESNAKEDLPF